MRLLSGVIFCALFLAAVMLPPGVLADSDVPIVIITIPDLDVVSEIVQFPLKGRTWAIDDRESNVGHLEGTAWLDSPGNIVLGGHSEYPDRSAGIFADLATLEAGDSIIVFDGEIDRFYEVTDVRYVHYTDLSVLYPTEAEQLTLITCDVGTYNAARRNYDQRVVVIAERID